MKKIFFLTIVFLLLNTISYSQVSDLLQKEFEISVNFVREHISKLKQEKSPNSWVYLRDLTEKIIYDSVGTIYIVTEYTYDEQGEIVESITSYTGQTYPLDYLILQNLYLYDNNYNLISIIVSGKDEVNDDWNNYRLYEYSYDNNNLITEFYKKWDSDNLQWNNHSKEENTYDANNDMINTVMYYWNEIDEVWRYNRKHDRLFNTQGQPEIDEVSNWDSSTEEWYLYYTTSYIYNAEDDIEQEVFEYGYGGIYRLYYEYTNSLLSALYFQSWHENTNTWIGAESTYYSYDNEDNLVHEHWQGPCPSSDTYHYYSLHLIGITDEPIVDESMLFPNPAEEMVYIKSITENSIIKITTVEGKEVLFFEKYENSIDISKLKKGVYFVNIYDNTFSNSYKLIKE